MGIKHGRRRAGKGKSGKRRQQSQARLESDRRKTFRQFESKVKRDREAMERRMDKQNRERYGSKPPPCPACQSPPKLDQHTRSGDFVWRCSGGCDTSVGCHPESSIPLGTMADKTTRVARERAHELFDKLWRSGAMTRKQAYDALGLSMGLTEDEAHIGMFSAAQCEEACAFARLKLRELYIPITKRYA
jgi:ribosomal protein L37AE/L43A